MNETHNSIVEKNEVQKKIADTRKKVATLKMIDKLEKEVARLEKNIRVKREKIEELAKQL